MNASFVFGGPELIKNAKKLNHFSCAPVQVQEERCNLIYVVQLLLLSLFISLVPYLNFGNYCWNSCFLIIICSIIKKIEMLKNRQFLQSVKLY